VTSANAKLVVHALRHFEAEGWEKVEPMWREDAVITGPPDWPESEPFRGRGSVVGQFRRLAADWEEHAFEEVEIVRDDGDWVVIRFTWAVRGAASGIPLRMPFAGAYRVDDGMLAEGHFRRTVEEAIDAAAISR
jgi:ketosteroid isomerase-like protein